MVIRDSVEQGQADTLVTAALPEQQQQVALAVTQESPEATEYQGFLDSVAKAVIPGFAD